jgi:hypothetical protein
MVGKDPDTPNGLQIGENIGVLIGGEERYYTIVNKDNIIIPIERPDLSAGSTDTFFEATELQPPFDQIYQVYNILVDGNVKVRVKQPAATNRFGTNRSPAAGELTDKISGMLSGQLINLWIAEDYPPSFQIENFTDETVSKPTIFIIGWRYQIKPISKPDIYTKIVIGGLGR